jgi:2'-hydroxyisoflavone reductase
MRLLILGGTRFLGRYLVERALARNHQVTLFNRRQSNPELFPEIEKLRGNRDGDLQALRGRKWDAVVDTCGFTSGQVRATAKFLADTVDHYTFISSISVYRDFTITGLNEDAVLGQLPEGLVEDIGNTETYGARKALAEQAAENAMPNRVLAVRAGLIVGPHDTSGRFLYWARRTACHGELLAPGNPHAPVQFIDVRDLADWTIRMVESGRAGIYNATGPASTLTFQRMLEQCRAASSSNAVVTWVDEQFLFEQNLKPFSDLPFWLPKTHYGFFEIDCRRSISSGLVFRSLIETVRDTLEWDSLHGNDPVGLDSIREMQLLRCWKTRSTMNNANNV